MYTDHGAGRIKVLYFGCIGISTFKEPVSPKVLCAVTGRFSNYTLPHWPFSKLIFTVVASENSNIFIARCCRRKQL